jgi:uncharacterized protein (DUF1800 family)
MTFEKVVVGMLETKDSQVAHLLRRTGYLATRQTVNEWRDRTMEEIIDQLLDMEQPAPVPPVVPEEEKKNGKAQLQLWWLATMRDTANPLLEQMTLFWHHHFTSAFYKVKRESLMAKQNVLLRKHALGNFREFVYEISIDPAMMVWLDSQTNVRKSPNENYARELMELFALGIDHYSEQDVAEAARALTGWKIDPNSEKAVFFARLHDSGSKTLFGKTGNYDLRSTVDRIVEQPACAMWIAGKVWSSFAYPNPPEEVIRPVADEFAKSGYEIKYLLRAIFTSKEFYSDRAYLAIVKSPVEYVTGILRAFPRLAMKREEAVLYGLTMMGQDLLNPPNVAGWPGGTAWLNSSMLLARYNFAEAFAHLVPLDDVPRQSNRRDDWVDEVLDRLGLLYQISAATKNQLLSYVNRHHGDNPALLRGLLHLALVSPEAQVK